MSRLSPRLVRRPTDHQPWLLTATTSLGPSQAPTRRDFWHIKLILSLLSQISTVARLAFLFPRFVGQATRLCWPWRTWPPSLLLLIPPALDESIPDRAPRRS